MEKGGSLELHELLTDSLKPEGRLLKIIGPDTLIIIINNNNNECIHGPLINSFLTLQTKVESPMWLFTVNNPIIAIHIMATHSECKHCYIKGTRHYW